MRKLKRDRKRESELNGTLRTADSGREKADKRKWRKRESVQSRKEKADNRRDGKKK